MPSTKDYYEILGINKNSSSEEIKRAYRNLAREHHPDMVRDGDKSSAEQRFKEINEAYQVLSNPEKRKMYDQFGHAGPGFNGQGGPFGGGSGGQQTGGQWGPFTYTYTAGGGQQGFGDFDPFDIFEDFFGFRGFGGQRRPKKGKNLYYEFHIDFKDSVLGVEKEINVESGKVKVKIPAGVHDGTELKFEEKGMPGPNGAPPGDLFLTIRAQLPKGFQRAGDVLATLKEIDMVQAALGDIIEVPVVDEKKTDALGKEKLKIPAGTQHGTQFRLRGKGMPRIRNTGKGDIIIQVSVTIPKKLNRNQRKILEQYKSL